jgi:hypothetical protein
MKLTFSNMDSWFETVWDGLYAGIEFAAEHRKKGEHATPFAPEQWDEICTAMAWIAEAAGHEPEIDT